MPSLLVITHPEVTIDPDIPITDWTLNEAGRHRAAAFAASETFAGVTHIWTSAEKKACDTAEILARPRNLPVKVDPLLGENDRSATGFLPPAEFEAAADAFFARPRISFCGWETAADAQARIHHAVTSIINRHDGADLAIVSHGAVGTLLWCGLSGSPIDRCHDQPSQGHYWCAELSTLKPETAWRSIA
ncbi:MAG: histidine phosphatase family protein [Litoreibacter sp.]|nr:histidine phosphatase family protein [Litoreibacter sp.]